jgi:UDP-N-acetylglucosamine 3-dehydrogenase
MPERLKVGVIGLGLIGSLHARIVYEAPHAELVAVADINGGTAKEYGERFSCSYYTDFRKMCDEEALDAVCVCTPDEFHLENAAYAAKKGIHLLIEKPLAKTEAEAREIVRAAEAAGVRMMVAQLLHFDPRYARLKETVQGGQIGDLIHMYFKRTNPRANGRRLGGKVSIFHFIGVHDIDMMCWCAQSKPTGAYCRRVSKINADIGCEDTVMAIIDFENGAVGSLELCWALPQNTALGINTYAEVVGSEGAAYVNIIMDQGVSLITKDEVVYPDTLNWPEYNGSILGDLKEEIHHFITATQKGLPYIVDTENAITAVKVIEACFKSIETGLPAEIKN